MVVLYYCDVEVVVFFEGDVQSLCVFFFCLWIVGEDVQCIGVVFFCLVFYYVVFYCVSDVDGLVI